jgi:type IV secretory pathway VirB4 component
MQNLASLAYNYKSIADKKDNFYHINSLNELLENITSSNEKLCNSNFYLLVHGSDLKNLNQNCQKVEYEIKRLNMKFDRLYFRQLLA